MAATFSRARSSRRAPNPSGVRRGLAVVALTGGIAGFATLGIAAVTNPVQAAPGNNGTVKVSGDDLSSQPNNEPHVPCSFYIQWYGFDTGTRHATVTFSAQAPTSGAIYAVTGDTSVSFSGGSGLDHSEPYTLTPSGADPQPQQGYHVKVTVVTDKSHGSDHKSKVFWIGPCAAATTPPTDQTTPPTDDTTPPTDDTTPPTDDTTPPTDDTTPPTDDTTPPTDDTTPPTDEATTPPTEPGSVSVPPTEAGSVATSTAKSSPAPGGLASTSTSPGPGAVVPTRIESGFATMPTSASTSQHSSDRWPLLAVSGLSAALGAAGLFPRRRGAKRS